MIIAIKKIIVLLIFNFTILQSTAYSQDSIDRNNVKMDTVMLNLAFECCDCGIKKNTIGSQFSFCGDGIEQFYGHPIFVTLNFDKFLDSYNQPVYLINQDKCLPKLDIPGRYEEVERIANLINAKNVVSFYDKRFKKAINKRAKRVHKSFSNFDGKFYYGLFKVKMVRMAIGEINKTLPYLELSKKNVYIFDRKVFAYCIIDILSIEPITKEEYLQQ